MLAMELCEEVSVYQYFPSRRKNLTTACHYYEAGLCDWLNHPRSLEQIALRSLHVSNGKGGRDDDDDGGDDNDKNDDSGDDVDDDVNKTGILKLKGFVGACRKLNPRRKRRRR